MTVREVLEKIGAEVLCDAGADRPVKGAVVGDLLSFVMGNASEGAVWVTVVAHANVAAVAVLKDMPCILIAADREAAPDFIERCRREEIAVGRSPRSPFDLCGALWELGLRGEG
ncbi:MAG TPA: serine kinase [Synergistaceae bacterium]|jgi:hypothetical protein|nr:serine kinase [Synergistaceae bacterium]HQF91516.1 serine kinase [Synergistaceae bacterium]HQH78518.1 serine kinase [Synergistaceae bacterium]HQK24188.1 serine kinase [Synergistaceae bacterium]